LSPSRAAGAAERPLVRRRRAIKLTAERTETSDSTLLRERGTELFLPVFGPTMQVGFTTLKDVPGDASSSTDRISSGPTPPCDAGNGGSPSMTDAPPFGPDRERRSRCGVNPAHSCMLSAFVNEWALRSASR
jgi:hypothetical protein